MDGSWYRNEEESSGLLGGAPPQARQEWLVPAAATAIVLFWAVVAWFAVGLVRALG